MPQGDLSQLIDQELERLGDQGRAVRASVAAASPPLPPLPATPEPGAGGRGRRGRDGRGTYSPLGVEVQRTPPTGLTPGGLGGAGRGRCGGCLGGCSRQRAGRCCLGATLFAMFIVVLFQTFRHGRLSVQDACLDYSTFNAISGPCSHFFDYAYSPPPTCRGCAAPAESPAAAAPPAAAPDGGGGEKGHGHGHEHKPEPEPEPEPEPPAESEESDGAAAAPPEAELNFTELKEKNGTEAGKDKLRRALLAEPLTAP